MKRVKRGSILITMCIVAVVLVTLGIQYSTQAQRPGGQAGRADRQGGRPGGQFDVRSMMMGSLEKSWAYASFEMELTEPVLLKAKRIYKKNWDEQKKLADKMSDAMGDRDAMQKSRSDAEKLTTQRHEKLKDILSPPELEKLIKWEEEAQTRTRRGRQR